MRLDGVLELSQNNSQWILWKINNSSMGARLVMQNDGDLVFYDTRNTSVWRSNTKRDNGEYLLLGDDGNLAVYDSENQQVWSTGTSQSKPNLLLNKVNNMI